MPYNLCSTLERPLRAILLASKRGVEQREGMADDTSGNSTGPGAVSVGRPIAPVAGH